MPKQKIWIRLGGFISVEESEIEDLLSGDKKTLVSIIKHGGFQPNGLSVIPSGARENDIQEDVEFDLDGNE